MRAMAADDLAKAIGDARQELFNLRFQHATGALENTARLRVAKRELARLLTIQSEQHDQEGGAA
jgi:large subunit ribosomal protein L29